MSTGFAQVLGQNRPKEIMRKALDQNRVAHAYLFYGPDGVGKEALAIECAKALLCSAQDARPCQNCSACRRAAGINHPDFVFIFPMPKNASIENEREILDTVARNAYARSKPWASPVISIERIRELRRINR